MCCVETSSIVCWLFNGTGRYIIKSGIVGSQGRIIGSDQYVGEDILLREDYVRYYAATALSYVDLFVLERSALMSILSSDNFPHVKVRVGGTPFTHWTTGGALVGLARGIDTMTRDDGVGRSSLACVGVWLPRSGL